MPGESGESGEQLSEDAALERAAEVARLLARSDDLDETLQRIVDLAVDYIELCDGASLMFVRGRTVSTPASTSPEARAADRAQYETGEGPCLSTMQQPETVVIDDIRTDGRWPAWRDEISHLGWESMVGLRLFIAEDTMGALNLYSRRRAAFDTQSQVLGRVFASHASVAMKAAISESGLQRALESRDVIGQAKGVLIERRRLSGEQAFDQLRELSNHHNVKLREIARRIVESGEIPG